MKITNLKIKSLFGLYDYEINFKTYEPTITILTAPNGYGKTTILNIIHNLNIERLYSIFLLKFDTIHIEFEKDESLIIESPKILETPAHDDEQRSLRRELSFIWNIKGDEICRFEYKLDEIEKWQRILRRRISGYRYRSNYEAHYAFEDIFLSGNLGKKMNEELARENNEGQFFLQLSSLQTTLIGANRIYQNPNIDRENYEPEFLPIENVVRDLKEMLTKKMKGFQDWSQNLDTIFIERILRNEGRKISEDDFIIRMTSVNQKISELYSLGLISKIFLPDYQQDKSSILDLYLRMVEEKLEFFNDFLPAVKLFNKKITEKYFPKKLIRVSEELGLLIESENGDIVDPVKLSTGEQNQLVILYNLIFKVPKGSILLIDEPESSLHVAWQRDIIPDFKEISKDRDLQVIIATHSPIIVNGINEDNVVDLYYIEENNKSNNE